MPVKTIFQLAFIIWAFGVHSIAFGQKRNSGINWKPLSKESNSAKAIEKLDSISRVCDFDLQDSLHWNHIRGKRLVNLSKYDDALRSFQTGMLLSSTLYPDTFLAIFQNQIGVVKYYLGLKEEAIDWFIKAEKGARKNKMLALQATLLNNIGGLFTDAAAYDSAQTYLLKALSVYDSINKNMSSSYLHTYRILATNYDYMGMPSKAHGMFEKMLSIGEATKDTGTIAKALMYMSYNEARHGDTESALEHSRRSLKLHSRDSSDITSLETAINNWAEVNYLAGEYKTAYDALSESSAFRLQLFSEDLQKEIGEMEAAYNTEAERQQRAIAESKAEYAEQQTRIVFIAAFLVVLILIGVFLFIRQRQQRILAEKDILVQKDRVAALIEGEERERTRIARDLHDGVSQLLSALKMNLSVSGLRDEQSLSLLDQGISEVRGISHNLLPKQLSRKGLISTLNGMMLELNQTGAIEATFESNVEHFDLTDDQKTHVFRIAQELTNNAVKHARANTIGLKISIDNGTFRLLINDDGIGMKTKQLSENTGIGWKNIQARSELLNGSIKILSTTKGSSIEFSFPISKEL